MKRFGFSPLLMLALGIFLAHTTAAIANDALHIPMKGVNLSGQVASDGKALIADDDNRWTVSNAEVLKGKEGRYITVRCKMNPEKRTIQVLSIFDPPTTSPARLGDSAFRR